MKSSMPTKRQNTAVRKKAAKKPEKNKTLFLAVAIVVVCIIFLITGYFFFRGLSDSTTDSPLKKDETPSGAGGPVAPVADEGFQAALEKAKLQLESIDNKDVLKVIVLKTKGTDNKEITYKYEWSINGQPAGNGSDSLSGFKRGDKVAVKVTPFDGETPGQSRTLALGVQNTTPKVSQGKEPTYDGKIFTAQINVSDPDGDTLSYELLSGPEGMVIDKKSGMIHWAVKEGKEGDYPVKTKISDGHGGETTYELTVTIPKELPAPETPPKKLLDLSR